MQTVLGIVVLYHPEKSLGTNLASYIHDTDHLLLIDNSEVATPWLTDVTQGFGSKVTVITNNENKGIATALNQGLEYASSNGFDWALTMDDDSSFKEGALPLLKQFAFSADMSLAIAAPFHLTPKAIHHVSAETKDLYITMTSGNLLRVDAWRKVGRFEDKLFIDSVDHEYCLRLRKAGYKITRVNNAVLFHPLGEIVYHRMLFLKLKTTNHSALRRYYITRNRFYVMSRYWSFDFKFFRREFFETIKSFFAVLLFEKEKGKKLRAMIRGTRDFFAGRYGKI